MMTSFNRLASFADYTKNSIYSLILDEPAKKGQSLRKRYFNHLHVHLYKTSQHFEKAETLACTQSKLGSVLRNECIFLTFRIRAVCLKNAALNLSYPVKGEPISSIHYTLHC